MIYIDKLNIDRGCDNVEKLPKIRFFYLKHFTTIIYL